MVKKSKAQKWRAVQLNPETKDKLVQIKEWFGESEAFHIRRAVDQYHANKEEEKARSKGVQAARKYLLERSEKGTL